MCKHQHLTLAERCWIEVRLKEGMKPAKIAESLGKHRTTVEREIKLHRTEVKRGSYNDCVHAKNCTVPHECPNTLCKRFTDNCTKCSECTLRCKKYEPRICPKREKSPYVCTGCAQRMTCRLRKMDYIAKRAQADYEYTLKTSREGIALSDGELSDLNYLFSGKIMRNLSISAIYSMHKAEITVCLKSVYNYLNRNLLDARRINLQRAVRRPYRKKSGPVRRVDRNYQIGRTYDDFLAYMEENPDLVVCQMDTVIGAKEGGKCILTIYFVNCGVQLMFLRERNTAASVTAIFDELKEKLGTERFNALFQVLLPDRGSEFTDPVSIEYDKKTGERLCRVFYCDPMNSNQKSSCERNHQLIRYIIPKGKSMEDLTEEDVNLIMNNINSYPRKKWNFRSPIELFIQIYGEETATLLGLKAIPFDSIDLKLQQIFKR